MRKFTAILTSILLMFFLISCGSGDTENNLPQESSPKPNTSATENNIIRNITYHVVGDNVFETQFNTSYWKMPFAREDDGQFIRDGYVLLGYSYDQNGNGELIRPGYKYTLKTEDKQQHLYCVWAKETNASDFTVKSETANTVHITSYKGSDNVVYIPRKIDGKTVTGIAEGAFANCKSLNEVHISSSVLEVEKKAFAFCSNLKTVTVYDNLTTISDASFEGSPIKTVRICAGQLPSYMNSYETYGKKYERLMQTAGQDRIVALAGSSVQFGVKSDYMQTLFENDYSVVNFGTNGNMNVALFLDAISPLLTEKDVVVFTPEQYGPYAYHVNGNPEIASATFQGLSTCYNLFENIDVSNYTNVFDAIGLYCTVSSKMPKLTWEDTNEYHDKYGDMKAIVSRMNSPDFRNGANGYFRFNSTVIPAEYIPHLNRVIDTAKASGAKVLFSYPPHNKNNIEESSLNEEAYTSYNEWIAKTMHCQLISDVQDYIYDGQYFDNTDYHLNSVGRKLNTEKLVKDIIAADIGVK